MRSFSAHDVAALARQPRPWDEPQERVCPACGSRSVRFYLHQSTRLDHPIMFAYAWCAYCRRYHGSTGPMPDGLAFEDPFEADRPEWGERVDELFAALDDAWSRGVLPQRFTSTPRQLVMTSPLGRLEVSDDEILDINLSEELRAATFAAARSSQTI